VGKLSQDLETILLAGKHMALRLLTSDDAQALETLHNLVFDSGVGHDWFDWKYIEGEGRGVALWHEHHMIAFCGVLPRDFCLPGQPLGRALFLQIGDVMVRPEWRAVLARQGAFFKVSKACYQNLIGLGAPFSAGFGFPSARHLALATKTGLGRKVGQMIELTWVSKIPDPTASPRKYNSMMFVVTFSWLWTLQKIDIDDPNFDLTVANCWEKMKQSLPNALIGNRSPAYIKWRFNLRPNSRNIYLKLRRSWSSKPVGIAVLTWTEKGDVCRWLDWIGPKDALQLAGQMIWIYVQRAGVSKMTTWASTDVANLLAPIANHQTEIAPIGSPWESLLPATTGESLPWWFMAGDTDFL